MVPLLKTGKSRRWLSLAGGLLLLVLTIVLAEPKAIAARLVNLDLNWLMLGMLLSVPIYLLFALRWQLVVNRLGAPLSYSRALQEYYLGTFVNQTLPTGMAGAALRTVRHANLIGPGGEPVGYQNAIRGVVLERISGLLCLAPFVLVGTVTLSREHPRVGFFGVAAVLVIAAATLVAFRLAAARNSSETSFAEAARVALLRDGAFLEQFLVSSLGIVLLILGFYCAARASHVGLSIGQTFLVAPMLLGAKIIPLAVAGWGAREAAAAALFVALGTDASTGVAVSVTFGIVGLLSSLPGLVVLLLPKRPDRIAGIVEDAK